MDDPAGPFGRQAVGQEGDQTVHGRDGFDLRGPVLFGPAPDLTREIVSGLAIVRQTDGGGIEGVQPSQGVGLGLIDGAPFGGRQAGQFQVPEDAAFDLVHHIEDRADDALVQAQGVGFGHGKALGGQGGDDLIFAVNRMGAGQQGAGWLAPQDIGGGRGDQLIGRVGLSALELAHGQRTGVAGDVFRHPGVQRGVVQPVAGIDLARAGKGGLGVERGGVGHGRPSRFYSRFLSPSGSQARFGAAMMAAFTARRQPESSRSRSALSMRGVQRAGASAGRASRSGAGRRPGPPAARRQAQSSPGRPDVPPRPDRCRRRTAWRHCWR